MEIIRGVECWFCPRFLSERLKWGGGGEGSNTSVKYVMMILVEAFISKFFWKWVEEVRWCWGKKGIRWRQINVVKISNPRLIGLDPTPPSFSTKCQILHEKRKKNRFFNFIGTKTFYIGPLEIKKKLFANCFAFHGFLNHI